jgi:hypothetical protein
MSIYEVRESPSKRSPRKLHMPDWKSRQNFFSSQVPTVIQGVREEQQDAVLGEAVAQFRTMPLLRSPLEKVRGMMLESDVCMLSCQYTPETQSSTPRGLSRFFSRFLKLCLNG